MPIDLKSIVREEPTGGYHESYSRVNLDGVHEPDRIIEALENRGYELYALEREGRHAYLVYAPPKDVIAAVEDTFGGSLIAAGDAAASRLDADMKKAVELVLRKSPASGEALVTPAQMDVASAVLRKKTGEADEALGALSKIPPPVAEKAAEPVALNPIEPVVAPPPAELAAPASTPDAPLVLEPPPEPLKKLPLDPIYQCPEHINSPCDVELVVHQTADGVCDVATRSRLEPKPGATYYGSWGETIARAEEKAAPIVKRVGNASAHSHSTPAVAATALGLGLVGGAIARIMAVPKPSIKPDAIKAEPVAPAERGV